MKRHALGELRAAIEANTERASLDDLKAQGKKHVRIVTSERVLAIIEAVVGDIVEREVGEITERDRLRIVQRTKQEFDRVLRLQQDQDGLIQSQKEMIAEYRRKLEEAASRRQELDRRADELRAELRRRNGELDEAEAMRDQLAAEATALRREAAEVAARHGEQERMLAEQREVLAERDGEIDRLRVELAAVREQAGAAAEATQVRGELAEMRALLEALGSRPAGPDEGFVESLLGQLEQRSSVDARALEERFSATLDSTLDRITRTMEAATAKPIEVSAEATEAVVSKLFDLGDDQLSSNLADLAVEERKSRGGIAGTLDRLKALRAVRAKEEAPADEEPAPTSAETTVSEESRRRMAASMDRLRSVRDRARADDAHQE